MKEPLSPGQGSAKCRQDHGVSRRNVPGSQHDMSGEDSDTQRKQRARLLGRPRVACLNCSRLRLCLLGFVLACVVSSLALYQALSPSSLHGTSLYQSLSVNNLQLPHLDRIFHGSSQDVLYSRLCSDFLEASDLSTEISAKGKSSSCRCEVGLPVLRMLPNNQTKEQSGQPVTASLSNWYCVLPNGGFCSPLLQEAAFLTLFRQVSEQQEVTFSRKLWLHYCGLNGGDYISMKLAYAATCKTEGQGEVLVMQVPDECGTFSSPVQAVPTAIGDGAHVLSSYFRAIEANLGDLKSKLDSAINRVAVLVDNSSKALIDKIDGLLIIAKTDLTKGERERMDSLQKVLENEGKVFTGEMKEVKAQLKGLVAIREASPATAPAPEHRKQNLRGSVPSTTTSAPEKPPKATIYLYNAPLEESEVPAPAKPAEEQEVNCGDFNQKSCLSHSCIVNSEFKSTCTLLGFAVSTARRLSSTLEVECQTRMREGVEEVTSSALEQGLSTAPIVMKFVEAFKATKGDCDHRVAKARVEAHRLSVSTKLSTDRSKREEDSTPVTTVPMKEIRKHFRESMKQLSSDVGSLTANALPGLLTAGEARFLVAVNSLVNLIFYASRAVIIWSVARSELGRMLTLTSMIYSLAK
jgi:hypothetical protein